MLSIATSTMGMGSEDSTHSPKRLMRPEVYSRDAMNDERALEDLQSYEKSQKILHKEIERGLSKCTKLVEERGIDLGNVVDSFLTSPRSPAGLTLELDNWVFNLIVADILEARLERLRALQKRREKISCRLQASVFRLSTSAGAAETPVMYAESCASQGASRPAGRAHARHFAADLGDDVTVPLLPKPTSTVASEEEENKATPLLHPQSSYNCTSGCQSEVIGDGAGGYNLGACLVW